MERIEVGSLRSHGGVVRIMVVRAPGRVLGAPDVYEVVQIGVHGEEETLIRRARIEDALREAHVYLDRLHTLMGFVESRAWKEDT
jgi:hypothetical protein